jgi:hypothetical protein
VLIFFLLTVFSVSAQTPVEMIINMNKTYAEAKSFSMSVEMKFFMGNNDVTPVNSYTGEACKSGDSYFSSIMGKTTIVNKNYTVYVDDGEKLIVYSKNGKTKKENDPIEIPDTSVFGSTATYSFGKGTDASSRIIVIPKDQSYYKKIELMINKKSFALEEVTYDYKVEEDPAGSVQKVTVKYADVNFNQPVPENKFSESHFIIHQKGKYIGTGKYADYKVVEQDNTLPPNLR